MKRRQAQYLPSEQEIEDFVRHSQIITGIPWESDLTKRHLEQAKIHAYGLTILHPKLVHHGLLNSLRDHAGQYRESIPGGREGSVPPAQCVPALINQWHHEVLVGVDELWDSQDYQQKAQFAETAHFQYLCINAFISSNGRVGRILEMVIRVRLGLPIKIPDQDSIELENMALRQYRRLVFIPTLPSIAAST